MRRNRIAIIGAVLVAGALIVAAISAATGWSPWPDFSSDTDTSHSRAVAETIAVQELCGSETTTAQEISAETAYQALPGWLAGRTVVGQIIGSALACSTTEGVSVSPADAGPDDPITVTLPEPTIEYAWIDVDETNLPRTVDRGLFTRVIDTWGCLIGSCDTSTNEIELVLRDGLGQVEQHALEADAIAAAEVEIAAMVEQLIAASRPGPVTVILEGPRPFEATTETNVATTVPTEIGTAMVVELDPVTGEQIVTESEVGQ